MKQNLWDADHVCKGCDKTMVRRSIILEGLGIRAWKCSRCEETVLHPDDTQRMLVFNKTNRSKE